MAPSPVRTAAHHRNPFDRLDRRITLALAAIVVPTLRIGLGVVFLWFGALKFVSGLSPDQDLATRTIEVLSLGLVTPAISLPLLAAWETLIGLGLLAGRYLRATLLLLVVQMAGTLTPLLLFPTETFNRFPYAPPWKASTSSRTSCSSRPRWWSARQCAVGSWRPSLAGL